MPSPVIKWVGGKRGLLEQMRPHLPPPSECKGYVAPFAGGEALFFCEYFAVRPAWLGDTNPELVALYLSIRDNVDELIAYATELQARYAEHTDPESMYWQIVEQLPHRMTTVERGARMLFLNRTGYNGLYRTNARGEFNVSWGKKTRVELFDENNLRDASEALQGVTIQCTTFDETLLTAPIGPGTFVYLDPPYVPKTKTAAFDSYGPNKFSWQEQGRVLTLAEQAVDRGAIVVASNAWVPEIVSLYQRSRAKFDVHEIKASRAVACKADSRAAVGEMLATTWRK